MRADDIPDEMGRFLSRIEEVLESAGVTAVTT
jgi:hypothetical protein